MKYLKYFESKNDYREDLDYIEDILIDIKDYDGEWEYKLSSNTIKDYGKEYKFYINIYLFPTYYDGNQHPSKIDETIISCINNCVNYLKDYKVSIEANSDLFRSGFSYKFNVSKIEDLQKAYHGGPVYFFPNEDGEFLNFINIKFELLL